MQYITRYDIKPYAAGKYREWLNQNESAIHDNSPEGWRYLGTWFTVLGFGKYQCEDRWEVDDYSDLGTVFGNEALQKLFLYSMENFLDTSKSGETYLMKSAEEVRIMEGT